MIKIKKEDIFKDYIEWLKKLNVKYIPRDKYVILSKYRFKYRLFFTSFRDFLLELKDYLKKNKLSDYLDLDKYKGEFYKKENIKEELENKILEGEILSNGERKVTILVSMRDLQDKTPNEILKIHGFDPLQWELTSHTFKAWNVYSKQDGINDLYSSTIKVKPIQNIISENNIEEFFNNIEINKIEISKYEYKVNNDKVLELPFMDLHFGKGIDGEYTNSIDEDLNLSIKYFKDSFYNLLKKILNIYGGFGKIILPIGQDLFNFDNFKGTTYSGTNVENNTTMNNLFQEVFNLIINVIESLRKYGEIYIYFVPGNHDKTISYFLVNMINIYYKNIEDVIVDFSFNMRKYIKFGNNLICYTHGLEKKQQLDKIIQAEVPKLWGETIFREMHLGHLHQEIVKEYPGFILRRISTITRTDSWHYENGYVGTLKKLQAFIWDNNTGLEHIINENLILEQNNQKYFEIFN